MLDIELAFRSGNAMARFISPPNVAELQPLDAGHVRLALSAHGHLVRTIEYEMNPQFARFVADGVMSLFEPEEPPGMG